MYGTWASELFGTLKWGCVTILYATILTNTIPARNYEPYIRFLTNCTILLLLLRLMARYCKALGIL